MGVDFYTCQNEECGYNYPDCGYFFTCTSCESRFCSDDCGGRQYVEDENGDRIESQEWCGYETTCILCRKESVSDRDMVCFLLKKMGLTYDQAVEMFRKEPEE